MDFTYLTIDYDSHWHQLVFGIAIYRITRHQMGCVYWQRLFGIGRRMRIKD